MLLLSGFIPAKADRNTYRTFRALGQMENLYEESLKQLVLFSLRRIGSREDLITNILVLKGLLRGWSPSLHREEKVQWVLVVPGFVLMQENFFTVRITIA